MLNTSKISASLIIIKSLIHKVPALNELVTTMNCNAPVLNFRI